jgi:toxin ParE1/3/4
MSVDNLQAALDFIDAAEKAFQSLAQMPELAPLWEGSRTRFPGMRVWPIPEFPKHLVFYRPLQDGIEVIRVCYGARRLERFFE